MRGSIDAALVMLTSVAGLACSGAGEPASTDLSPAYTITLSPGSLNVAQGSSTPPYGVSVARTNFVGDITLTLERPGAVPLPAGMTATFAPNPLIGSSALFTITVALNVPAGTYQLLVRGSASGIDARTVALTVRVISATGT